MIGTISIKAQGFPCYDCTTTSALEELTAGQLADLVNFYADIGDDWVTAKRLYGIDKVHIDWVFNKCRQINNGARSIMRQNYTNPLPTSQANLLSQFMSIFDSQVETAGITSTQVNYVLTRIITHSHRTGQVWDGDWDHYAEKVTE